MDVQEQLKEAYTLQGNGSYAEALKIFESLAGNAAYHVLARLEIGKTSKMMQRMEEAIDAFIETLRLDPAHEEALRELRETAILASNFDKSIAALKALAERRPSGSVFLELGRLCLASGDLAGARACVGELRARQPGRLDTEILFGRILVAEDELEQAEELFRQLDERSTGSRALWREQGDLYYRLAEVEKAVACYEKIVAPDKHVLSRLAELHALAGNAERSDKAVAGVIAMTPDDAFFRDAELNRVETLQRKTVLMSTVKRLWVSVTSRCNIRCKTCGLWHRENIWDLPYETAKQVMALYPTLERVVWLGGEVFLYEHFEEMFDEAARHPNLRQQVITNGYILTDRWVDKLVHTPNVELTLSIDGTTKEVYESIRVGSNFDRLMENLRRIRTIRETTGMPRDLRMNSLIMRSNYRQLEEFIEFAHREGIGQVSFLAVHLDLAPQENIFYEARDAEALRYIGERIPVLREKAKAYGIDLDILLPPGDIDFACGPAVGGTASGGPAVSGPADGNVATGPVKEEMPKAPRPQRKSLRQVPCKKPWQYMMLCDNGDVILTGSCIRVIGNVNDNTLAEIWNSPAAQDYRKAMLEGRFEGLCRTECMSRW